MIVISEVIENQINSDPNNVSLIFSYVSIIISAGTLLASILFSVLTYHFNKKSHYSNLISTYRNEWLKRVKDNTSQFISIAMTENNGDNKYKKLLTYKLKIFSDLNIISNSKSEDNSKSVDENALGFELQNKMNAILKASKSVNKDPFVKKYYEKSLEELIRLLNIFYTVEWEITKKNAMPGHFIITKSNKKVSSLLEKYDLKDENGTYD